MGYSSSRLAKGFEEGEEEEGEEGAFFLLATLATGVDFLLCFVLF